MGLARALLLAFALAAPSSGCVAGPQPEPPTGGDVDGGDGRPTSDAGLPGGGSPDAAVRYDAGARDAGAALDAGVSPGPSLIPPKPVDYPPRPPIGRGPWPPLVDGSHATVDGGVTAP